EIVSYWLDKGVDGFRYDMAEMVPVEFWSYLNSAIKMKNSNAFLLAEVYNPLEYRNYLQLGRMDYLYDTVGFSDTLKPIMQGQSSTDTLAPAHADVLDIEEHMLHFLENHDEQRIASAEFAGDANKGKPAMVVSALISRSPTMLYFAQDVGEPGDGNAGFGIATRTTIFDYWGVPSHQRWMNGGAFDGGQSSQAEKSLRDFYIRLMNFSATNAALTGGYAEIHSHNRKDAHAAYNDKVFSFVRWNGDERLIVLSNFDADNTHNLEVYVPADIIEQWQLTDGRYMLDEQLYRRNHAQLIVDAGVGRLRISLTALESAVLRVGAPNVSGSSSVDFH
ncbi:MAG: alpha-amylase family glycosyl hydrolase, partial [Woeseiaceae bacterium]